MEQKPSPQQFLGFPLALIQYLVIGGFCASLNVVLIWLGVKQLHINYLLSAFTAYLTSTCVGYTLNRKITFSNQSNARLSDAFLKYVAVTSINIFTSLLFIAILVEYFAVDPVIAGLTATAVFALIGYKLHDTWTFRKTT